MISGITWRQLLRELRREFAEDRLSDGAAALAFYQMLAVFPAAIFLLTLLPYLPIPRLDQAIMDLLYQAIPGQAAELFASTVRHVTSQRNGALLSFGLLFTVWSASGGMRAMLRAINVAYDIDDERPWWQTAALSLALSGMFLVLVIGAMGLVIFGGVLQSWLAHALGWSRVLLAAFATIRWVVIAAALILALSVLYHFAPYRVGARRPRFRFVTPGSVLGLVGLVGTSLLFRVYVGNFGRYDRTYGSLGTVIVLLMWLYLSSLVVLVGAELNAVLEQHAATTTPAPAPTRERAPHGIAPGPFQPPRHA